MRTILFLTFSVALCTLLPARKATTVPPRDRQVKNLILMIPDGTSWATVSLARWMQFYNDNTQEKLAIDPYLCGSVRTTSSNAPIGDSAPTTSCYMTGYNSLSGFVATYPVADPTNDIYPVDSTRAYQPLTTLLEAAHLLKNKSTGLVFTCEFPHATPADCSAHSYSRSHYDWITPQMVHNNLSVVLGGGAVYLTANDEDYLRQQGYSVYLDESSRNYRSDANQKLWALFAPKEMSYDLDRDPQKQPSLAEMTQEAIKRLSQNKKGFFLLVEGSKIDWAAHANDPVGMYTDMLSFDRACAAALEFAKQDGSTAVVIVPDHGNSGLSLGRNNLRTSYDKLTKDDLFQALSNYKLTAEGLATVLNANPHDSLTSLFRHYASLELSEDERQAILHNAGYTASPIPKTERMKNVVPSLYSSSLSGLIARIYTAHTGLGFTSTGHTGEEVFLAAYHPKGQIPLGMQTNVELHHYLCSLLGLEGKLDSLTTANFAPHQQVFQEYTIERNGKLPTLIARRKNSTEQYHITPFTNYATVVDLAARTERTVHLPSVVVYVDKNNTFYLPASLNN